MTRAASAILALALACGSTEGPGALPPPHPSTHSEATVTVTVIGTNDIHGNVERMPAFAAYVDAVRAQRKSGGGGVILLDGGDMFQGTVESNLGEGAAVVELMNAIGYDGAAVGNHEFDFGPSGPRTTPREPGDDPRGALKDRAAQASFPFLAANVFDAASGRRVDWPNVLPSTLRTIGDIDVGIIGLSTVETPQTTIAANVVGLEFRPLAPTVIAEAQALRQRGADVVIVAAHAGGKCSDFTDAGDLSSCDPEQEIFELARTLPQGTVDVIVAGHTHSGVAHRVAGVAIIEQFAYTTHFGRVDVAVGKESKTVKAVRVFPPQPICLSAEGPCALPESYEGEALVVPPKARAIADSWATRARKVREEELGAVATTALETSRERESAVGNWIVDLILATRPADVALINGGGLRSDVEPGPIRYGDLHRVFPFDNRFAHLQLTGEELRAIVEANLADDGSILSFAGLTITATCKGGDLEVVLRRPSGAIIADREVLEVVTSDFLATTGSELVGKGRKLVIEDEPIIRDVLADWLRKNRPTVSSDTLLVAGRPRVRFPGKRPVSCSGS